MGQERASQIALCLKAAPLFLLNNAEAILFATKQVKTIKQPTLIIWGKQDGLTPIADGERFRSDIANSTMLVFDQCGHAPNIEKAMEFNAAVLKFLGGR